MDSFDVGALVLERQSARGKQNDSLARNPSLSGVVQVSSFLGTEVTHHFARHSNRIR
jgi:hypothetical protein